MDYRLDELILNSLAKVAGLFSEAKYYTELYSLRRTNVSLDEQSAKLFKLVVQLLIQLLTYAIEGLPSMIFFT